jgi:hypothetical protein
MVFNVTEVQKIPMDESIKGVVLQQSAGQCRPVLALEFAAL